jgi:hypothetical protein
VGESDARTGQGRMAAQDAEGQPDPFEDMSPDLDPIMLEPTEAELEEWAERERKRRQQWLNGPSSEERAEWARRERMRRLARLSDEDRDLVLSEWTRQMVRYPREAQLAMEGMFSVFFHWSRRQMAEFVRAGRDWEDQFGRAARRRRVHLDPDDED